MNYFKRAWLSVVRRQGKSLILLVVIFILGNVIAGAFSIQQASKNVEKSIKQQLGATANIELDWQKLDEEYQKDPSFKFDTKPIDLETIEKIGQNRHVRYYDYSFTAILSSDELKRVEAEKMDVEMTNPFGTFFSAQGVQYPAISDIVEGKIELTSGRVFTQEEIDQGKNVAVVSESFAKENGLSVGDKVNFLNKVDDFDQTNQTSTTVTKRDVSVEIIGLFKPLVREVKDDNSSNSFEQKWQVNEMHNKLYIPNKLAYDENVYNLEEQIKVNPQYLQEGKTVEDMVMQNVNPTFAIENPESLEAFRNEVSDLVPEFYKLKVSSDAYDSIAGPIASLDNMSQITLVVAIGATILILSLVIVLFLRDRKHELGIYLSLGDRRNGVLRQIVMEVAMVAIVGLSLSLVTGNFIASGLSQSLMNNATANNQNEMGMGMGSAISIGGSNTFVNVSEEDAMEAYKVELTPQYIGLFYLIGLGVTIGSTIVPIVYITRLNPKKIMM